VFGEAIPELLESNPTAIIVVTPSWANGTDNFKQFFLSLEQQARVSFNSISAYLYERLPVDNNIILGLTSSEYQIALNDPKIGNISINRVVNYPDGNPGFYFVNIAYAENADEMFFIEKEARQSLIHSTVNYRNQNILIEHSMLDMGEPSAIFDGDVFTLMRGLEANPLIIDIFFEVPIKVSGIVADFANMDFTINAKLYTGSESAPVEYSNTWRGISGDPHIEMIFQEAPDLISRLRLEIYSHSHGERAHIHVRELELLP